MEKVDKKKVEDMQNSDLHGKDVVALLGVIRGLTNDLEELKLRCSGLEYLNKQHRENLDTYRPLCKALETAILEVGACWCCENRRGDCIFKGACEGWHFDFDFWHTKYAIQKARAGSKTDKTSGSPRG